MDITDPAIFLGTTAFFGPKGHGTMVLNVFQYMKSPGMMMVMMTEKGSFSTCGLKRIGSSEREKKRGFDN